MTKNYSGKYVGEFPRTRHARKDFLEAIDKSNPIQTGYQIPSEGGTYDVYAVDIDFLMYNFENGRYLTSRHTREKQIGKDIFEDDSNLGDAVAEIERILWDEDPDENEETVGDLLKHGQEVPAVIDAAGVVVSGNRRLRLLHEIKRRRSAGEYDHSEIPETRLKELEKLKVAIIGKELSGREIDDYESRLQYGEKGKLDYGPIQKYFIVKRLKETDKQPNRTILENNKEMPLLNAPKDIEKFIRICGLIDEYLNHIGKPGMYTLVDDAEDMFRQLDQSIVKIKNGDVDIPLPHGRADLAVTKFKKVFFPVIRDREVVSGKKYYRKLINIFENDPKAWSDIEKTVHGIGDTDEENPSPDDSSQSTEKLLEDEQIWKEKAGDNIKNTLNKAIHTQESNEYFSEAPDILEDMAKKAKKVKEKVSGTDGREIIDDYSKEMRGHLDDIEGYLDYVRNMLHVET